MPTTSDILAGRSEDAVGGNEISQSDTAILARKLLGDSAVDQFGDVIGARPPGVKDVVRDFAIGFQEGAGKVEEIKALQRKAFNDAVFKQQQQALAQKKVDMQQVGQALDTYKKVQGLPAGVRSSVLKSTLEGIGITPDPAALKIMLEGDIIAQLPMEDIFDAHSRGELTTAQLQEVFGTAKGALDFVTGLTRAKKDREQTNSIVLDLIRKKQQNAQRARDITEETTGIQQDFSPKNVGDPKTARAAELAAREKGIASADQPFNPQFKGVKTDKIRAVMKREALPPKKKATKGRTSVADLVGQATSLTGLGGSGEVPRVNSVTKVQ